MNQMMSKMTHVTQPVIDAVYMYTDINTILIHPAKVTSTQVYYKLNSSYHTTIIWRHGKTHGDECEIIR